LGHRNLLDGLPEIFGWVLSHLVPPPGTVLFFSLVSERISCMNKWTKSLCSSEKGALKCERLIYEGREGGEKKKKKREEEEEEYFIF
jgi:hypothetical protein